MWELYLCVEIAATPVTFPGTPLGMDTSVRGNVVTSQSDYFKMGAGAC